LRNAGDETRKPIIMIRKKIDVDIIKDVLEALMEAQPHSTFVQSLYRQYQERGGLSKKQLEGLYNKSLKVDSIPDGKRATLEAVILKRPTRYKSAPPPPKPMYEKDERIGKMMEDILAKYPQHKRVVFLKAKYDNNETLTPAEVLEVERFTKVLK
jgi:RecJ-like exonuclease